MSDPWRFNSPLGLKAELAAQEYIATIVFLGQELGKPILVEGPASIRKAG